MCRVPWFGSEWVTGPLRAIELKSFKKMRGLLVTTNSGHSGSQEPKIRIDFRNETLLLK